MSIVILSRYPKYVTGPGVRLYFSRGRSQVLGGNINFTEASQPVNSGRFYFQMEESTNTFGSALYKIVNNYLKTMPKAHFFVFAFEEILKSY